MTDIHAGSCRRMWCAVLWAVLDDYNSDYHLTKNKDGGVGTLRSARRYILSQDGLEVIALAGVDVSARQILAAIRLPRVDWQIRSQAGDGRARLEDAA